MSKYRTIKSKFTGKTHRILSDVTVVGFSSEGRIVYTERISNGKWYSWGSFMLSVKRFSVKQSDNSQTI